MQKGTIVRMLTDYPCPGLGFKKEELRVAADTGRKLSIGGECATQGDQWRRFHLRFELPKDCNVAEIQANFDRGVLYVLLPKSATSSKKEGGRVLGKNSTLLIVMIIVAIALAFGLGISLLGISLSLNLYN